jgi:triosephosphate isomerase
MRRLMVAGNWKLNGSTQFTKDLIAAICSAENSFPSVATIVAPSFVHLSLAADALSGSAINLSAQNVSEKTEGAYTGEVSADMLRDVGCKYAILGHSERRHLFGEDRKLIADKAVVAQEAGLMPILCLGETLDQRKRGVTLTVIEQQLHAVLSTEGVDINRMIFAYEPVWAIGTGETATPGQAQEIHAAIRHLLAVLDSQAAKEATILYGGSVKPGNAAKLFAESDVDGALVGGASLDAEQFIAICQAAQSI